MKICDKYVIEQFWPAKQSVLKRYINSGKVDDNIIEYLKNRFDDTENIYESLYRIKYGLNTAPKCPICGNPIPFTNGYNEYCSRVCANKNPKRILHAKETFAKKRKSSEQTTGSKITRHTHTKLIIYNNENPKKVKITRCDESNYKSQTSNLEDIYFDLLSIIYNDIVRQYISDKYKFRYDFYIPSHDLYIELRDTWTHGGHPYTENCDDLEKLRLWKLKVDEGHLYYKNAIYTWTVLDIIKRNTAKENNLNYIEFWKLEDVIDYIKKYKENI